MRTHVTSISAESILQDMHAINTRKPIIHNITNYVVMNSTANALLAIGASPIMAHAKQELPDILALANALVINIGTLDAGWLETMLEAVNIATALNLPIIIDPVGAGASTMRTNAAHTLICSTKQCVIRGNASEILALTGDVQQTNGVDNARDSTEAVIAAKKLSSTSGHTIVVSGPIDYCVNAEETIELNNGSPLMSKVTGMGCASTAIIGAFLAVNKHHLQAATHAMAVMGVVGELSGGTVHGPGGFAVSFLDALYHVEKTQIENTLKVTHHVTH